MLNLNQRHPAPEKEMRGQQTIAWGCKLLKILDFQIVMESRIRNELQAVARLL